MAFQYIYTYIQISEKEILGVDKVNCMYKKGKAHGEEYWMFRYYQWLCF